MLSLIYSVAGRPWAIQAEIALHIRGLVAQHGLAGLRHLVELKQDERIHASGERHLPITFEASLSNPRQRPSTIAVIPVIGTLTQRVEQIGSASTRSTSAVAAEVLAAAAEPKVDAIVLEVDSPGGEVFGVPEAWTAIRTAAGIKPVVASVNSAAGSAAYYLASAATEMLVTPSGMVGSIGVYALHVDMSKSIEAAGEKWTFISAGKYKVEGNPAEPLGDEARGAFQAEIDRYYAMFVRDVARGRGVGVDTVRNGFGEGRMVGAKAAVEERMADQVGTFDEAIRRAAHLGRERRRETASARAAGSMLGWS